MDFDLAFGICLLMVSLYFGYSGKSVRYILIPTLLSTAVGLTQILRGEVPDLVWTTSFGAGLIAVSFGLTLVRYWIFWWIGRWIGRRKED